MIKKRNRVYRRIAVALTVALLAGQSHAFVLAEEGDTPQTEITGEADMSTPDSDSDLDNDSTPDGGNDSQNPDDNGNQGDQQGDGNGQDKCICGTKCTADVVNTDCPVCAENYEACARQADDKENQDIENGDPENNDSDPENGGQDNQDGSAEGIADGQKCVCETSCTEEAVNADCPVCAADYANCAQNAGGGVNLSVDAALPEMTSGNMSVEEAGIVALAGEGVEAYAVGDTFYYPENPAEGEKRLKYRRIPDKIGEVEVAEQGEDAVSGKVTIPLAVEDSDGNKYTVKSIGEYAFKDCSSLTGITIPGSVTSIERFAFFRCNSLASITIPESVISIGTSAFDECSSLTSVTIPDSVKRIGDFAFSDCSSLTSITIPDGVTCIEKFIFFRCSNLTSVTIPDRVTSIEDGAFDGCSSLTSITIPDGVRSIGYSAFWKCSSLTGITIPNSVVDIGHGAFSGCSSLTSIEIPNGVTSIREKTFNECSSLESITIPNSVTNIAEQAFYKCKMLDTLQITISSGEKYHFPIVGTDAFTGLPNSTDRNDIIVKKGDGLSGDDLKAADVENAFIEAAKNDGDSDNSAWYGWPYIEVPEVKDTHKVTITVQKDDTPWTTGCDRTFALTKDGGTTLVTNLDAVEAGEYEIVDVTDSGKKLDTGVTVTVADTDASATVEYYTVAFCYLDDDGNEQTYGDSTDWKPQTILKTVGRVTKPATNPTKADHTFDKWVTAPNGETTFAFGTTEITAPGTKIYAKWTQTTVPTHKVTITVQKDDTPWTDHNFTFALTKDGATSFVTNLDAVEAGEYEIYDITDSGKKLKTGVTVKVADADVPSTDPVNYYTVAFCYLDDDGNEQTYGDSTDWKPQIVLEDKGRVAVPATNPAKADHTFDKWVTAPNGETAFAFETTPITAKDTKIYAKWTENTVTTYHTVTFYDGTTPYGEGTPQKPQRVASGQQADRPDDPEKAGWEFAGWKTKTADGGSTDYNFDTPVTGDTNIYASWVKKTVTDSLRIQATATEGGTIAPKGEVIVSKGGERIFTITPDEGNKIKTVTVDAGTVNEKDVTAELKDTLARAQAGARYYTFTNVTTNHTIHAEFERNGGGNTPDPNPNPGGGDNPDPNPNPGGGGGGDNPDPGDDGDNKKPGGSGGSSGGGGNSGGGDNTNSGGGNNGGGTNPDGGNGMGNAVNADTGNGAGNGQTVTGTAISSAQAGNGVIAASAGGNTASGGSKAAGGSTSSAATETAGNGTATGASGQTAGGAGTAANGKEPKTGDASYLQVYATLAMIAGLTYLLLYVMEESRGMSEREKEAFVAAFIRWGKKGGAFRKCCAMAAIFCLLAYYHIIGKNVGGNALRKKHLGQAF